MEVALAIEKPNYFEGTPDLSPEITIKLIDKSIKIYACAEQVEVRDALLKIKKGDTLYFEPTDVTAWSTSEDYIGVSFLQVNQSVILDEAVLEGCEKAIWKEVVFFGVILLIILFFGWVKKYSPSNNHKYSK